MSQRVDLNDVRKLLREYVKKGEFTELIDDRVSVFIQPGQGISWIYNDIEGSLIPNFDSSTIPHGTLAELSDDDHTQYALANGNRDITGDQHFDENVTISGSLSVTGSGHLPGAYGISHINLTNLESDTHTQYALINGNRAFTGTVAGIDPVVAADLVTKRYVDAGT